MRILEGITEQHFLLWIRSDLPKSKEVVCFQMGRLPGEGGEIERKNVTFTRKNNIMSRNGIYEYNRSLGGIKF